MLQILHKLKRWWNPRPEPLQTPRRLKNYVSQTGFQYQYYAEPFSAGDYKFVVWTTGQTRREIRITVPLPELAARERYALAKLRLFRAFDEHEPSELPAVLEVTDTAALDAL